MAGGQWMWLGKCVCVFAPLIGGSLTVGELLRGGKRRLRRNHARQFPIDRHVGEESFTQARIIDLGGLFLDIGPRLVQHRLCAGIGVSDQDLVGDQEQFLRAVLGYKGGGRKVGQQGFHGRQGRSPIALGEGDSSQIGLDALFITYPIERLA